MILLCEGHFDMHGAKTATGLIIWRPEEIVAVIDSVNAGRDSFDVVGSGKGIPVVAKIEEAVKLGGNELVIGVANPGGVMVPGYREVVIRAMELGCDVTSGLHEILSHDHDLAMLATKHGVTISDVRLVPEVPVGWNRARTLRNKRVLTVGSDCNVGKMCASISLEREFRKRGHDAKFVPTGQTGILIEGDGLCIDRAICDFASGIAEKLVVDTKEREWVFIEGQGSIDHPAYSGVTLSLLHGTAPQALILCHHHGRKDRRHEDGSPLLPLERLIELHEVISTPILPTKVVGISVITKGMDESAARKLLAGIEDRLGMPATDSLRFGVANIADALIAFFRSRGPE